MSSIPAANTLTSSPLRNSIRVLLNAHLPEVWQLVGDHSRLPEYSTGITRVDVIDNTPGERRTRLPFSSHVRHQRGHRSA